MSRKEIGDRGEKLAGEYLKKKGYKLRQQNYRCRYGEIDIIAEKKKVLVFIEVRTKTGTAFGTPEESVTAVKKEKLIASAMDYLSSHDNLPQQWRIDFVAVELDKEGKASRIDLIENAICQQ